MTRSLGPGGAGRGPGRGPCGARAGAWAGPGAGRLGAGAAPLRSFALTDNVPVLTAWANDTTYDRIYAAQIEALVDTDDVVIAISSSGRSPNIVAAVRSAQERGAHTIGLTGFDGGPTLDLVDVAIHVPVHDYGIVEDVHAAVGHALTAAIRAASEKAIDEQ